MIKRVFDGSKTTLPSCGFFGYFWVGIFLGKIMNNPLPKMTQLAAKIN